MNGPRRLRRGFFFAPADREETTMPLNPPKPQDALGQPNTDPETHAGTQLIEHLATLVVRQHRRLTRTAPTTRSDVERRAATRTTWRLSRPTEACSRDSPPVADPR